ncbi:MAG: hypothetical protein ORN26_01895 [Candidatus Pacebacteria bacterium]|nr:hypothetical protein [Candidatus Paceibacterota bacterium]
MKISKDNNSFIIYIAKYIGVALIAGSVVHIGTLNNGIMRYVILIVIGLIFVIFGNLKEAKDIGQKINLRYFFILIILASATGFLSGGVQHYIDNPLYAGILLGIGLIFAYITFFLKDGMKMQKGNIIFVMILSIFIIIFSYYFRDRLVADGGHHKAEIQSMNSVGDSDSLVGNDGHSH